MINDMNSSNPGPALLVTLILLGGLVVLVVWGMS